MDWSWACLRSKLTVAHNGLDVLLGREPAMEAVVQSNGVLIRGWLWLHRRLRFNGPCSWPCGLRAQPVQPLPQMAGGASALCFLDADWQAAKLQTISAMESRDVASFTICLWWPCVLMNSSVSFSWASRQILKASSFSR